MSRVGTGETQGKNTLMSAKSGAVKQSPLNNERIYSKSDVDLLMFEQEHHAQILNENYYQYSSTAIIPLAGSASAYTWIRNNTGRDVILYPVKVSVITDVPSQDIELQLERRIGATVNEVNGTDLVVYNLGDISASVTNNPVLKSMPAVDVTDLGTEVFPLRTYQYGREILNEEERGERYILPAGGTLLGVVKNLTNAACNIWAIPAYSFVDPLT